MSESIHQAVFVSYAREDNAAARRIAEALRGQGVEVWLDQDELRGGDAWDAKIRKQVKDCALFLCIISRHTQKRKEGYFRLEWRLAEQRTHLMGRTKAFLVPVCIDDTREADADVPEGFLSVQWTRLPAGEPTSAFLQRMQSLLADDGGETATERAPPAQTLERAQVSGSASRRRPRQYWLAPALILAGAVAAFVVWRQNRPAPTANSSSPPNLGIVSTSDAASLIARTRHLYDNVSYGPADLALAERFMAQATDLAPDSAEAWALRGYVQASYVLRTWDTSAQRLQDAQNFCNRALALDPNQTEAMLGLAIVSNQLGAFDQVETLMHQAIRWHPDDPRLHRMLGIATSSAGHFSDGLAILQDTTRRFPRDPLSWYDLARVYEMMGNRDRDAVAAYKQVVSLVPMDSAFIAVARILSGFGDLEGAQAAYDQIPPARRTGDRAVGLAMWLGLLERKPDRVVAGAGLTATNYFEDAVFRGPKANLIALAFEIAGKKASADLEWNQAAEELRQRLQSEPTQASYDQITLAIALIWKGNIAEAKAIAEPLAAAQREMPVPELEAAFARYYAGLGDAPNAVQCLRNLPPSSTHHQGLKINPWYMKIQAAPEFQAYIAELAPEQPAAGSPN